MGLCAGGRRRRRRRRGTLYCCCSLLYRGGVGFILLRLRVSAIPKLVLLFTFRCRELLSTLEGEEEPRYSQSVIQSFSPWNSLSSIRVTITTCPCKALYRFCINSTHSNWPSSSCVRMCRLSPVIQLYITHTHVVLSGFVLCPT